MARGWPPALFAFAGIWTEFKGDQGTKSKTIPLPHLVYGYYGTECGRRTDPSQGDAGDPDDRRGARCMDARHGMRRWHYSGLCPMMSCGS
jgi:hypothetical protein